MIPRFRLASQWIYAHLIFSYEHLLYAQGAKDVENVKDVEHVEYIKE